MSPVRRFYIVPPEDGLGYRLEDFPEGEDICLRVVEPPEYDQVIMFKFTVLAAVQDFPKMMRVEGHCAGRPFKACIYTDNSREDRGYAELASTS